jgi:single-stranded DNA-binding protein
MQSNVFIGNLASKPSMKIHGHKLAVTNFTVISNEYVNEETERKVVINFTAFGSMAENIVTYFNTGDQIILTYRIENNNYKDDKGIDVYSFNFIVEKFEFGSKSNKNSNL